MQRRVKGKRRAEDRKWKVKGGRKKLCERRRQEKKVKVRRKEKEGRNGGGREENKSEDYNVKGTWVRNERETV